ncbi:uncharacterized protein [Nyctibius grandis]|uniref:uncharacterized protein n=1 Tax=Nyctibius grandis TaxID=48427 RepID=UPI0035BBE463
MQPVPLHSLSELERASLQELALYQLQEKLRLGDLSLAKVGPKGSKSIRQKLESFSKERKGEQHPFPRVFGPCSQRELGIFDGAELGGARVPCAVVVCWCNSAYGSVRGAGRGGCVCAQHVCARCVFVGRYTDGYLSAPFNPGLALRVLLYCPLEDGSHQPGDAAGRARPDFLPPVQSPLEEITQQQSDILLNAFVACSPAAKPLGPGWCGGWG